MKRDQVSPARETPGRFHRGKTDIYRTNLGFVPLIAELCSLAEPTCGLSAGTFGDGVGLPPLPSLHGPKSKLSETHRFSDTANWVVPGLIMQGMHPAISSGKGSSSMSSRIDAIVNDGGCLTFVCLQAECQPQEGASMIYDGGVNDWILDPADLAPYREEALLAAVAAEEEKDVTVPTFLHYGIRDMDTAESIDRLTNVVSHLADRIYSGESIYIHCWGGKGRSGLVASCLLGELYETVDADEALERVGEYCRLRNEGGIGEMIESPETEAQRNQVRQFYKLKLLGVNQISRL